MTVWRSVLSSSLFVGALASCAGQNAAGDAPPASTGGAPDSVGTGGATLGSGGAELAGTGGASGGAATGGVGTGGAGTGGSGTGGIESTGGTQAGGSGGVGTGGAGTGGSTSGGPQFECNQVVGLTVTSEWYLAGFETYVDDAHWQLKWQAHSYVADWANPAGEPWNAEIVSPCTQGSTSPDRIVFTVLSWDVMPQQQWEDLINSALDTFQAKYPDVARFDLMTIIRGPGNQKCGDPTASETVQIPAELDAAIAAVAADSGGLVYATPKFEAPDCATFDGAGPHMLAPGVNAVATTVGEYFADLQ